jgi:hypothetical protein
MTTRPPVSPGDWTCELASDALRAWVLEHERLPSVADWRHASCDRPSAATVRRLFGSWTAAFDAAGLQPRVQHRRRRWDRDSIIALLREDARRLQRPPTAREWTAAPDRPAETTVRHHLGSWSTALRAANLPAPTRHDWTREDVLAQFASWASIHGRAPTAKDWQTAAAQHPSNSAVTRLFGSWSAAVQAAGLTPRKRGAATTWPRARILELLREDAGRLQRAPTWEEWRHATDRPSPMTVTRAFESWPAALQLAGLAPQPARDWTREQIIAEFAAWARTHGRPPTKADWRGDATRYPRVSTVRRLMGSWTAAAQAAGLPAHTGRPTAT